MENETTKKTKDVKPDGEATKEAAKDTSGGFPAASMEESSETA